MHAALAATRNPASPPDTLSSAEIATFSRPLRIGVVTNPRSRRNLKGFDDIETALRGHGDVPHRRAGNLEEMAAVVDEFAAREVDIIAVNGGDGTVHALLTDLLRRRPFPRLPLVAILAGGGTNMTATDIGTGGRPGHQLRRLLRWAEGGPPRSGLVERPVMCIEDQQGYGPLYGQFFSAAAIPRISQACWDFRARTSVPFLRGGLGTAVVVTKALSAFVLGRMEAEATRIQVQLDERAPFGDAYAVLFVTSLERMAMGMRPYWGDGPGRLHFTAVSNTPRSLLRAVPALIRGRPNRYLTPENGYFSDNAEVIRLHGPGCCTVDGELYDFGGDAGVSISLASSVCFIRP